jgi:hypothetical protein
MVWRWGMVVVAVVVMVIRHVLYFHGLDYGGVAPTNEPQQGRREEQCCQLLGSDHRS